MGYNISKGPIPKKTEHKPGPKKPILGAAHFDALRAVRKLARPRKAVGYTAPPGPTPLLPKSGSGVIPPKPAKKAKRLNKKSRRK